MGRVTYLLDTNVLSEPLLAQPNRTVIDHLIRHEFEIAISSTTWHEALFGLQRLPPSKRRRQIERYLMEDVRGVVPILPFEEKAADWLARERARLTAIGRPPPFSDGQIAAVAAINELILVTRNERDFTDFHGLKIENWFTAA